MQNMLGLDEAGMQKLVTAVQNPEKRKKAAMFLAQRMGPPPIGAFGQQTQPQPGGAPAPQVAPPVPGSMFDPVGG